MLRRGEAAGLRWSDIDFDAERLTVRARRSRCVDCLLKDDALEGAAEALRRAV